MASLAPKWQVISSTVSATANLEINVVLLQGVAVVRELAQI
jgi:hypothetical protein